MPVARHWLSKRPAYLLKGNSLPDVEVPVDIRAVVEIYERMSQRLAENDPNQRNQSDADADDLRFGDRAVGHGGIDRVFIVFGQKKCT